MREETESHRARLQGTVDFLANAARLKDTLRSGFTIEGRPESTAEHTWRLCLMALVLASDLPEIDHLKLLKLCIVHDLGEAVSGDIPAIHQTADDGKAVRERVDLLSLCEPLAVDQCSEIMALYDEYEAAATSEAIIAKGLDKLETVLQHAIGGNPADDFDYAFNLGYGAGHTARHPLLAELRAIADAATSARLNATN